MTQEERHLLLAVANIVLETHTSSGRDANRQRKTLREALAPFRREPTPNELLEAVQTHQMTPAEIQAQRESWVRGMTARCEHGALDFEQCPHCRKRYLP